MHADMEQLIQDYASSEDILIATVQCQLEDKSEGTGFELCARLMDQCTDVLGFPTLCFGDYNSLDNYTEYVGPHSYSTMHAFVEEMLGPGPMPPSPPACEDREPESKEGCEIDDSCQWCYREMFDIYMCTPSGLCNGASVV